MTDESHDRPRPRPEKRFSKPQDHVDLGAAAEALLDEPQLTAQGHRQKALFRHGPATLALYCFEAGGHLPLHVVDGTVIIHVLEGSLRIRTPDAEHAISADHLLRLAPGVPHDLHADKPSRMLLTVCVEGPDSHAVR